MSLIKREHGYDSLVGSHASGWDAEKYIFRPCDSVTKINKRVNA